MTARTVHCSQMGSEAVQMACFQNRTKRQQLPSFDDTFYRLFQTQRCQQMACEGLLQFHFQVESDEVGLSLKSNHNHAVLMHPTISNQDLPIPKAQTLPIMPPDKIKSMIYQIIPLQKQTAQDRNGNHFEAQNGCKNAVYGSQNFLLPFLILIPEASGDFLARGLSLFAEFKGQPYALISRPNQMLNLAFAKLNKDAIQ